MKRRQGRNGGANGVTEPDDERIGKEGEPQRRNVKLQFLPENRPRFEGDAEYLLAPPTHPTALSEVAPLPPPPFPPGSRQSSTPISSTSNATPGAFAATTGIVHPRPQQPARISSTNNRQHESLSQKPPGTTANERTGAQGTYLAVASLVDNEELPRAEVVDSNKAPYLWYGVGAVFLLFLASGIVLAIVLSVGERSASGSNSSSSGSSSSIPESSFAGRTGSPSAPPTLYGTLYNDDNNNDEDEAIWLRPPTTPTSDTTRPSTTVAPSSQPSTSSPTMSWLAGSDSPPTPTPSELPPGLRESYEAYITSLLPNYTLDAMQTDPWSPQSLAFNFVKRDPYLDSPPWRVQQRFALATFFYATGGNATWQESSGWLTINNDSKDDPDAVPVFRDECQWFASPSLFKSGNRDSMTFNYTAAHPNPCNRQNVANATQGGRYQNLWLWDNRLIGTLPREFFWLTDLKSLNLDEPSSTANSENFMSQALFKSFGLEGQLSSEIGLLTNLEVLSMAHNRITGTVPTELMELSSLKYLGLPWNQLSGPFRSEIGQMSNLEYLIMWDNEFDAFLPTEIGMLSRLKHLDIIQRTKFSLSAFPTELTTLTNLESLSLSLNGTFPTELFAMSSLTYLRLTEINGTLPSSINTMTNLKTLFLERPRFVTFRRSLKGTLPTQIGRMDSLSALHLGGNSVSGLIPSEIALLTALRVLDLTTNRLLGGRIPSQIGMASSLQHLSLQRNSFTGIIPTELAELSALTHLDLSENRISGSIPAEFGMLWVYLPSAGSTTDTSKSIYTFPALEVLNLANNRLNGSIPTQFGNLTELRGLRLDRNELSGTIPSQIQNLAVDQLLLQNNLLTGVVPNALCDNIGSFDCGRKYLCGCECLCSDFSGPTTSSSPTTHPTYSYVQPGTWFPSKAPETSGAPLSTPGTSENVTIIIGSGPIRRPQNKHASTVENMASGMKGSGNTENGDSGGARPRSKNVFCHPPLLCA